VSLRRNAQRKGLRKKKEKEVVKELLTTAGLGKDRLIKI
jgi:hypothetical protein